MEGGSRCPADVTSWRAGNEKRQKKQMQMEDRRVEERRGGAVAALHEWDQSGG